MPNEWLLVFVYKGVLATSGYTMPLDECIRTMALSDVQQMQCVNVKQPICKVHKDITKQADLRERCVGWMREKE